MDDIWNMRLPGSGIRLGEATSEDATAAFALLDARQADLEAQIADLDAQFMEVAAQRRAILLTANYEDQPNYDPEGPQHIWRRIVLGEMTMEGATQKDVLSICRILARLIDAVEFGMSPPDMPIEAIDTGAVRAFLRDHNYDGPIEGTLFGKFGEQHDAATGQAH